MNPVCSLKITRSERCGEYLFCVALLLALLPSPSAAAHKIWIPEGVKVLRGVHIGFSDACTDIGSTGHWQDFARHHKYAMICLDRSVGISRSSIQGILDGFATSTGHPELSHVPFTSSGFSWSSGHSVNVSRSLPERCVAVVPSGIGFGGDPEFNKVPLITIQHEGNGLEEGFESVNAARAQGALWAADPRYNGFHNWDNNGMLVLLFYDYCHRERVTLTKNALSAPVPLLGYSESDGWIIPRDRTFKSYSPTVLPLKAHCGLRNNLQWFSSEYMARVSRSYNVFHTGMFDSSQWEFYDHWLFGPYYPTENSPSLSLLNPPSTASIKYPYAIAYGTEQQMLATYSGAVKAQEVVFYDGDMPLKKLTSSPYVFRARFAPGYHGIYAEALLVDGSWVVSSLGVVNVKRPGAIETRLVSPRRSDRPLVGSDVTLEAEAVTDSGTIARVKFFVDGAPAGEATGAPYRVTWKADAAGDRVIRAVVTGSKGDSTEVFPVKIAVVAPSALTSLHIRPSNIFVAPGASVTFSTTARDQYQYVMQSGAAVTWTVDGGGSIDNAGKFTAGNSVGGPFTVTARAGSVQTTTRVYVSGRIRVNFQPPYAECSDGFLVDDGKPFASRSNGFSYGWNKSVRHLQQRPNHPYLPVEYTTFIPMHSQEQPPYNKTYSEYTWEMAIANGTYRVRIVAGDMFNKDIALWQTLPKIAPESHVYKIKAEEVLVVDGQPTNAKPWVEGSKEVTVADGKLTISNAVGQNWNKICFLEIIPPGDNIVVGTRLGPQAGRVPPQVRMVSGAMVCRIDEPGRHTLELSGLDGRVVARAVAGAPGTVRLPLSAVTAGTYLFSVSGSRGTVFQRAFSVVR